MNKNEIKFPSNKKFGLFFTSIFVILAIYVFNDSVSSSVIFFSFLSLFTLVITLIRPSLLTFFNRLWMNIGTLMGKVVSPIALGTIFFLLITPIALITRLFSRDELRLKMIQRDSDWKIREPVGAEANSFKNQF